MERDFGAEMQAYATALKVLCIARQFSERHLETDSKQLERVTLRIEINEREVIERALMAIEQWLVRPGARPVPPLARLTRLDENSPRRGPHEPE